MHTRWARFARGWLAAGVATVTAAASHTLGGAHAPAPAAVALALAFSGMLCVLLAGRTLSLARLGISVVLSQLAYHLLFQLAPGGGVVRVSEGEGHVHDGGTLLLTTVGAGSAHPDHGGAMLIAHGVAALLTIAALRVGERSFWEAGRLVLAVVLRLVVRASAPVAPVTRTVSLRRAERRARPHVLDVVLSALRHRGPPRSGTSAPPVPA